MWIKVVLNCILCVLVVCLCCVMNRYLLLYCSAFWSAFPLCLLQMYTEHCRTTRLHNTTTLYIVDFISPFWCFTLKNKCWPVTYAACWCIAQHTHPRVHDTHVHVGYTMQVDSCTWCRLTCNHHRQVGVATHVYLQIFSGIV